MVGSGIKFGFLVVALVSAADFEQQCVDLTDGGNVKSYYFRGSCYVSDKSSKPNYDNALGLCTHMKRPAYLPYLPGTVLVNKMFQEFSGHWGSIWAGWLGFKRNGTAGSASNKDYFDWYLDGEKIHHAHEHAIDWGPGYPAHTGLICGCVYAPYVDTVIAYICSSASTNHILCQYHGYRHKFKKVSDGVRGAVNDTFVEHSVPHSLQCSKLCAATVICQSYSYIQSQGLCALHMLPAEDLPTEELDDSKIYDMY